jgi:hypothetical protein
VADAFDGAVLQMDDLSGTQDHRAAALTFFHRCRDVLRAAGP